MNTLKKITLSGGNTLLIAMMLSNVVNLLFNIFLGRILPLSEFGVITLINTLSYILSVFLNALGGTVNQEIAYLTGQQGKPHANAFLKSIYLRVIITSTLITGLFLIFTPYLSTFFHFSNITVLLMFAPAIIMGAIASLNKGYLLGGQYFAWYGIVLLLEAVFKILIVLVLYAVNLKELIYLSIPFSIVLSSIVSIVFVNRHIQVVDHSLSQKFPLTFYFASMLTGLSSNAFLTLDVVLVKHYFSPMVAGQYSLLSLVGKIIYFLGGLLKSFLVTFVAHDVGAKKNPLRTFYWLLGAITVIVGISVIGLVTTGVAVLPFVFGAKALSILPLLGAYSLTIALFTITNTITIYHLTLRQYIFPWVALIMSGVMAGGIILRHHSIQQVVLVMLIVSTLNLIVNVILHLFYANERFFRENVKDFMALFRPLPPDGKKYTKRILIFNWRDTRHAFAGGAEVYIHELSRRWVKAGCKVTVFCGNDGNCPRYETIDGVEIIRRGGFYFVYVWAFLYYVLKLRNRYDIIIDSENGIPFFTPFYVGKRKYLLIHHVHQDVFRKSLPYPLALFACFLELKLMPLVYRNTQLITVSPSSQAEIMQHELSQKKPTIIYNGVDLETYTPTKKSGVPHILYLGRLKYYKSLNIFIKAAARVHEAYPEAKFTIAGSGEEMPGLKRLVDKLHLQDAITFTGKVTEADKLALFRDAYLFVNPSFMEGWGITTIEANACGTPVIASNVPGLRDSIKHGSSGYLVDYGDVKGFAERIIYLIEHKDVYEKMSRDSVAWARNFDWQKSADAGLQILKVQRSSPKKKSLVPKRVRISVRTNTRSV